MIRNEVQQLLDLGPLPRSEDADPDSLDRWGAALKAIVPPITDEEARVLVDLFGPDECFGAAWSLLHLIETAAHLPRLRAELMLRSEFLRTSWRC